MMPVVTVLPVFSTLGRTDRLARVGRPSEARGKPMALPA